MKKTVISGGTSGGLTYFILGCVCVCGGCPGRSLGGAESFCAGAVGRGMWTRGRDGLSYTDLDLSMCARDIRNFGEVIQCQLNLSDCISSLPPLLFLNLSRILRRKTQNPTLRKWGSATHSSSRAQSQHISLGLRSLSPFPSPEGLGPSQEGVRVEEGVNSSYYSLPFPDRETEADTLSNFPEVTKLRSIQDSNSRLIKSKYLLGNYVSHSVIQSGGSRTLACVTIP